MAHFCAHSVAKNAKAKKLNYNLEGNIENIFYQKADDGKLTIQLKCTENANETKTAMAFSLFTMVQEAALLHFHRP